MRRSFDAPAYRGQFCWATQRGSYCFYMSAYRDAMTKNIKTANTSQILWKKYKNKKRARLHASKQRSGTNFPKTVKYNNITSLTTWQANGFIRWWYKQVTTEHCQATPGYSVTSPAVHHEIDRVQHYQHSTSTVYRQSDLWSKAGRFIHLRIYTNIKFLKVSGH